MAFADQAVQVEKSGPVGSLQGGPPEPDILAVFVNRTGASFETGRRGHSGVPRLLVFCGRLADIRLMKRERKPQRTVDQKLDEALSETFPASDPVSIGRNDHPGKPADPPPDKKKE